MLILKSEGGKKKCPVDFKLQELQPVYTVLMNIILKTNIYVKQPLLAVNLILKRGLVFKAWYSRLGSAKIQG